MPDPFDRDALRSYLVSRMFGEQLVENRWRGDLVEQMVASALNADGWSICSADWASWDLEHERLGLKMQVKQTARLQTWGISPPTNRYSIKPAKGFYRGSEWNALAEPLRLAEIYVFAHHPVEDAKSADHWDARQWQFHVAAESSLPPRGLSISIVDIARLSAQVGIHALADEVRRLAAATKPNGRTDSAKPAPGDIGDRDEEAGGSL